MLAVLKALLVVAHLTKTKEDDAALMKAIRFMEGAALLRMGRSVKHDDHGSGIGGVPMLCIALGIGIATAGCHGGEVRDARSARTDYVLGAVESALLIAGQALVKPYEAKEAQCAAGPVSDYVDCTDPGNKAIDALSVAYYSTRAARDGLDAGRGAPALPCIAEMLDAAVSAVGALDVELPDAVTSGMSAAQSLAPLVSGQCEVEP